MSPLPSEEGGYESDDPVEFLENDDAIHREGKGGHVFSELDFHSPASRGQQGSGAEDDSEDDHEDEGMKKSFSRFSHDIRKESKRQRVEQRESSQSVGSLSTLVTGSERQRIYHTTPNKSSTVVPSRSSAAMMTPKSAPVARSKASKTDIDRPKHWTSSTLTPLRNKRPSSSCKIPRKQDNAPVTPKSTPNGQLSFRPTFMKTHENPSPPLLDPDDSQQLSIESTPRNNKDIPIQKISHNRKFREGSLSHLLQHLFKESEGLQVQFSVSLPHFPIQSAGSSPERSKDFLNPRNRTKYWVNLSFQSVDCQSGDIFLVCNMTVVDSSPESPCELIPGCEVRVYFRTDRLNTLGINQGDLVDNMIRVYDFSLLPLGDIGDQSQLLDQHNPPPDKRVMFCTQLCEIIR